MSILSSHNACNYVSLYHDTLCTVVLGMSQHQSVKISDFIVSITPKLTATVKGRRLLCDQIVLYISHPVIQTDSSGLSL